LKFLVLKDQFFFPEYKDLFMLLAINALVPSPSWFGGSAYRVGLLLTYFVDYGAPLKNGVLTENGRLVCPWHGTL